MKKLNVFLIMLAFLFTAVNAQNPSAKAHPKLQDGLKFSTQITTMAIANEQSSQVLQSNQPTRPDVPKNTDVVSIVSIGTSANAYGYANGGRSNVNLNNSINVVSNFHRMGGNLDPGGYSGDLGFESSADGGMDWNPMMYEIFTAKENVGGTYYLDAARYPQHGLYNPPGNTDPNEAYIAYFAAALGGTNGDTWGGYVYGRGKIGDPTDTTYHFVQSPGGDQFFYVPDGYTLNSLGEFWVTDVNQSWQSGAGVYLNQLMITHGVWDEAEDDFVVDFIPLDLQTIAAQAPANTKVEFSPDGQTGYIVALADNGQVAISSGMSYYPVLFRTTDGGDTWSDPIPVAIAGTDGIEDVQNFLSDEEIAELYEVPVPDRDEIPFTTAFDFDLSVDAFGNPHIAVFCGVSVDAYTISSGISPSSGYLFTCAFLLSSSNLGNEGTWIGYELGRPVSFRGNFGDLTEDNRIQIARNHQGSKMFVSWLDTDINVSAENNSPDIWARGVDIVAHKLTSNNGDYPDNVSFGSEATFSAYFFAMGNEVFTNGSNYTIPYTYENMNPIDPAQPVQFKYIQDFMYNNSDFTIPYSGTLPFAAPTNLQAQVNGNTVILTWDAPPAEALLGYSVYRDGIKITPFKIPNTTYTNVNVPVGIHSYYVTAVYSEGTSEPSNAVDVFIQNTIPEYFTPIWTSPYNPMTFYIIEANIDEMPLLVGDEVGLFDIDPITGEEICVGAGLLVEELVGGVYLEMIASMDDGSNPAQANGFTPGNSIIYKLYNAEAGEITTITASYPYPGYDEVYTSQGSAFVELNGVTSIEQCINLATGWNLMSFRAIPENPNMLEVVQPLIDDELLVKVLDETGGSIFHLPFPPPNGQWSNTIGDMENTEGYYVKVDENGILCVEGQPVETPLAIPLTMGWNIIGYPCEYAQNALVAVQALIDDEVLLKVIDEAGGTIFHLPFPPPNGQWSNTIGDFESGEGYYLKVSENTTLTIACPADFVETSFINPATIKTSHFVPVYQNNPYMPMHIALAPNEVLEAGDEVGIFDGDVCVGASVINANNETVIITCSQHDPISEIIDGFTEERTITLSAWTRQTGIEAELLTETIIGKQIFEGLETYAATIQGMQTGISENKLGGIDYELSPNPFDRILRLRISLPSNGNLKIELYNLMGQKMNFTYNSILHRGSQIITLDNLALKKGTYLVHFTFSNETSIIHFSEKIIKN